jgi:hypothetical protein
MVMPSLKLSFEQLEQKFVTSRCGTVHRLSFVASATTALLHEVWTPGNLMGLWNTFDPLASGQSMLSCRDTITVSSPFPSHHRFCRRKKVKKMDT